MKDSMDLYELVHSLSKSEKRYITLSIMHGGEKAYLHLFRLLEKQEKWDEKWLRASLGGDKRLRRLPAVKHYLYNYILKKLSAYYADGSDEILPHKSLMEIDILYRKSLYAQTRKKLLRLKKVSEKNEDFATLLYYYRWEKRLLGISSYKGKIQRDINRLFNEEMQLLKKIENLGKYYNLSARMLIFIRGKGEIRNKQEEQKIRTLLKDPYLKSVSNALSNESRGYFYYIRSGCYYLLHEYKRALKDAEHLIKLLEPGIYRREAMLNRYINALNNIIIMHTRLKNYENALSTIQKLRFISEIKSAKKKLPDNARIAVLTRSYEMELSVYMTFRQFDRALKLVPAIEQIVQNHKDKIEAEYLLIFYYNIGYIYFIFGNYKDTLHYLSKILNYSKKDLTLRGDLYSYSKLLQLITHYEIGTEELSRYLVQSVYRFLMSQKRLYKIEDALLRFLRKKVLKDFHPRHLRKDFGELKQELVRITASPYEKKALEYFDFISWLESKTENRPFVNIMKEKNSGSHGE